MALICTQDDSLVARISTECSSCAIETVFIKNGREIPEALESNVISVLILDTNLQEPCIIDIFYLLSNIKSETPIIILSSCDEKVLLSIIRIATTKNIAVYPMRITNMDKKTFKGILKVIDQKSPIINDEIITSAMEKKLFCMYYQPKLSLITDKLVGVEALIRWNRANHGLVSPDAFIPLAEETGLIIPLTYWIIREVFSQYARWKKEKMEMNIAINLSAQILTDVNLPDELGSLCNEFAVNPRDICFEITESAAMRWPERVLEVLTRIRLKGFSLSIDDFGTGYSSLVELQRQPFTELKIDKSFVMDLEENIENQHIVRAIINLGKNLGLSLIAEGVETLEAKALLKELGCDTMQGFLIAKPMAVTEFNEWYHNYQLSS